MVGRSWQGCRIQPCRVIPRPKDLCSKYGFALLQCDPPAPRPHQLWIGLVGGFYSFYITHLVLICPELLLLLPGVPPEPS